MGAAVQEALPNLLEKIREFGFNRNWERVCSLCSKTRHAKENRRSSISALLRAAKKCWACRGLNIGNLKLALSDILSDITCAWSSSVRFLYLT